MRFVCAALAACNAVESRPTTTPADDNPDLAVVESDLLQCGIGCSAGNHPTGFSCNLSCGSCSFGNNQTDCQPNSGSFMTCGIASRPL